MKKQNLPSTALTAKALYFLLGIFVIVNGVPTVAHAQGGDPGATVKFIGTDNNQLQFDVAYENKQSAAFSLQISDEQGTVLYKGKFKEKQFSRKFAFNKAEIGDSKLFFTITNQRSRQSQTFEIATQTRIVEDVVITRL